MRFFTVASVLFLLNQCAKNTTLVPQENNTDTYSNQLTKPVQTTARGII